MRNRRHSFRIKKYNLTRRKNRDKIQVLSGGIVRMRIRCSASWFVTRLIKRRKEAMSSGLFSIIW